MPAAALMPGTLTLKPLVLNVTTPVAEAPRLPLLIAPYRLVLKVM